MSAKVRPTDARLYAGRLPGVASFGHSRRDVPRGTGGLVAGLDRKIVMSLRVIRSESFSECPRVT